MGRFDLSFKSLADSSPLTMLRLFAHAGVDEETRVEQVERELGMHLKSIDHAFHLFRDGASWLEHFEAELVISADDLLKILLRGVSLRIKYDAPVWTTIILLSRHHAGEIPDVVKDDQGSFTMLMCPRVISLWEMSPDALLQDGAIEGLPVVAAMNATRDQLDHVLGRLSEIQDREIRSRLSAEMVTWSSLRYTRDEVLDIRARLGMVTTKEVLMASPIGEEILEYGKREGRLERRLEGRLEEARGNLTILASRFPGLLDPNVVGALNDLEVIGALFRAIVAADDLDGARAGVARVLGQNQYGNH